MAEKLAELRKKGGSGGGSGSALTLAIQRSGGTNFSISDGTTTSGQGKTSGTFSLGNLGSLSFSSSGSDAIFTFSLNSSHRVVISYGNGTAGFIAHGTEQTGTNLTFTLGMDNTSYGAYGVTID